ncbi:MAG: TolC family protein [Longimicrobiales bacterium]
MSNPNRLIGGSRLPLAATSHRPGPAGPFRRLAPVVTFLLPMPALTLRRLRQSAIFGICALGVLSGSRAGAQEPRPATLTLDEAIQLARQNNPEFRQTANDEGPADWAAREAFASFLPSLSVSNSYSYQASGTQRLGNLSAADFGLGRTPGTYASDYGVDARLSISGSTFFQLAQQRANQTATEARIDAAAFTLATNVTRQYLAALRQRDNVTLSQSALDRADEALKLAEARQQSGAATRLEVAQAQVERGRAEVALIQAQNSYDTERVRLMQELGVEVNADVELTSQFEVFEPTWTLEDLTAMSISSHPGLIAARRTESAASAAAKASWSQYLPTLNLGANIWSGYSRKVGDSNFLINQAKNSAQNQIENCEFWNTIAAGLSTTLPDFPEDCSQYAYSPVTEAAILEGNSLYPFNYTTSPAYFFVSISLPIFDGFTRERSLQQARAAADDAMHLRRAEELTRRTEVATNLLALRTAYRTVELESKNSETAGLALELARERYRLGAGSILELTQAQEDKARADQSHLAAVYTFHESLAALQAAVGTTLGN